MVSTLIVFSTRNGNAARIAAAAGEGARKAGAGTHTAELPRKGRMKADTAPYSLVIFCAEAPFLSADRRMLEFAVDNDLGGKKAALACAYSMSRDACRRLAERLAGKVEVVNTLSLKERGAGRLLGRGSLSEDDLVRASAFAEKTVNNYLNRRIVKESRKAMIENYRK